MSANSRESQCEGKDRLTADLAKKIAKRSHGRAASPYKCPYCSAWHVGSHLARTVDARRGR